MGNDCSCAFCDAPDHCSKPQARLRSHDTLPNYSRRRKGDASQGTGGHRHLDFNPIRIAKRMTLPVMGRALVFDGEVDQNAFFDFWTHEYRVDGKTLVEHVDPAAAGLDALETELLEAARHARASFFQIEGVAPAEPRLRLRDLLEPDRPDVWLTDLGLSDSMRRFRAKLALFCRLITVQGITMTSGFSFGFEPERVPGMLQAYRQKMKKVPPEALAEARFVFFFHKFHQFGIEQSYQDVV
jgi:hypothetical protein